MFIRRISIQITACLLGLMWLAAAGAQAAPPKAGPLLMNARIVLDSGKTAALSDVRGDGLMLKVRWHAFLINMMLSHVRGLEFTGPGRKQPSRRAWDRPVVLTLASGDRLTCELSFWDTLGLSGKWDFGKKTIPFVQMKSATLESHGAPARPQFEPAAELSDLKGNKLPVGPDTEFRLGPVSFVQRALFGSTKPACLPMPQGSGLILVPRAEVRDLTGDGVSWTVNLLNGKSLTTALNQNLAKMRVAGRCPYGEFSLDLAQLGRWQWTKAAPADKATGGLANQKSNNLRAIVTDSQGRTFRLDNVQYFYCVRHYGMWIPRTPQNYPVHAKSFSVNMADKQKAEIELSALGALAVKKFPGLTLTAKSGNTIQASLRTTSGRKGVGYEDPGFIGRFGPEQGGYWGFLPLRSIKEMKFE